MPTENTWTVDSSYVEKLEENRRKASKEGQAEAREAERTRIYKENKARVERIAAIQAGEKTDFFSQQIEIQKRILGLDPLDRQKT